MVNNELIRLHFLPILPDILDADVCEISGHSSFDFEFPLDGLFHAVKYMERALSPLVTWTLRFLCLQRESGWDDLMTFFDLSVAAE